MMLVTGGAGFIGSNIVDRLLDKGYPVKVLDNLASKKKENLESAKKDSNFELIVGDICDFDSKILEGVDTIFHEAAQIDVRKSVSDPLFDSKINIGGTINILENMRKHDVSKIIYASSGGAMYGNPEYVPCDEKHPVNPVCPYGASKFAAEKYIQVFSELYGIDYVALRYANVYGPRQDPMGEAGVISIFLNKILNGEKPIIFGDGKQTRDYVQVYDVVDANILALEKLNNDSFNVGTGIETSVNQLVEVISGVVGREIEAVYESERPGEVKGISLDISKISKFGFEPKYNLKDGIKTVLDWISS